MRIQSSLLVFCLSSLISATHIRISIPSSPLLPNPAVLPPSTRATLTTLGHVYTAPLRADNSFDFRNVSSGSYLMDVHSHTHGFAPLRVDVLDPVEKGEGEVLVFGTFRGNEWSNKGEAVLVKEVARKVGVWGFEVKVLGSKEYLVQKTGFSPLSLLKNPMILIAGVSMILVFGMPYLMDNMDPEMRAEFEATQKNSPLSGGVAAANPLQNFDAAAWLSGAGTKKTDASAANRVEAGGAVTR